MKLFNSFVREAAFMWRERSVLAALVLACALSCLSVLGGLFEAERQQTTITQLTAADQQDRTLVLAEQESWGGAAYYSFHLTVDPPTPFAFAAMGQRDNKPWKHRIRMLALEGQIYEKDASNPVIALIGRFDFSFFAAFVLPFIMIVLLHDIRASEQSAGRKYLLLATAGTAAKLWPVRTTVIAVSLYVMVIIPLIIGCLISVVSWAVVFSACIYVALYVIFWAVVCHWFASWNQASAVILTCLLGFWSLVAIIIPTGGRMLIDRMVTVPSGSEILMSQREAVNDAWDLPKAATMRVFLEHHPEWSAHAQIERPFEWKWYYAFQRVGDLKTAALSAAYRQGRLERDRLAGYLAMLAPPAWLERSLQGLAETDTHASLSYEQQVRAFHAQLRDFYYPLLFKDQAFDREKLTELPKFDPGEVQLSKPLKSS